MIHSNGISFYKSEDCNAWPILGDVLELSPFSRPLDKQTRAKL